MEKIQQVKEKLIQIEKRYLDEGWHNNTDVLKLLQEALSLIPWMEKEEKPIGKCKHCKKIHDLRVVCPVIAGIEEPPEENPNERTTTG